MIEAIGWISSIILLLTLARQVYKQWKTGTVEGVSKWLFIGQLLTSTGFTIYSYLIGNWVFIVTNFLLVLNSLLPGSLCTFIFAARKPTNPRRSSSILYLQQ